MIIEKQKILDCLNYLDDINKSDSKDIKLEGFDDINFSKKRKEYLSWYERMSNIEVFEILLKRN